MVLINARARSLPMLLLFATVHLINTQVQGQCTTASPNTFNVQNFDINYLMNGTPGDYKMLTEPNDNTCDFKLKMKWPVQPPPATPTSWANTSNPTWIDFSTGNGATGSQTSKRIKIFDSTTKSNAASAGTYTVKLEWWLYEGTVATTKTINYITLTITDICETDTLTATAVGNKTYVLGSTLAAFPTWTYTQSVAMTNGDTRQCLKTTQTQYKKSTDSTWLTLSAGTPAWVQSFTKYGNMQINTSSTTFVGLWQVRQIETIDVSNRPTGSVTSQFTVDIQYECTTVSDTVMPDITYEMTGAPSLVSAVQPVASATTCQYTLELEIWEAGAWKPDTDPTFPSFAVTYDKLAATTAKQYKIFSGTPTSDTRAVGIHQFKAIWTIVNGPASSKREQIFSATIIDTCASNRLTITRTVADQTYNIGAADLPALMYTYTQSVVTPTAKNTDSRVCATASQLYIRKSTTATWSAALTVFPVPNTFIKSYTNGGSLVIALASGLSQADKTAQVGTWFVREVMTATASTEAVGAAFTSQFSVMITDSCNADVLTITTNIASFSMNFGATAVIKTPATTSASSCAMTTTSEYYNTGTGTWGSVPTQAWSSTITGPPVSLSFAFATPATPTATFSHRYRFKTISDLSPLIASGVVYDEFTVTFKHACSTNTLLTTQGIANKIYDMQMSPTAGVGVYYTAPALTGYPANTCAVTCKLEIQQQGANFWLDYSTNTSAFGFVNAFDTSGTNCGRTQIQTSSASKLTYDPAGAVPGHVYKMRTTQTDPNSEGTPSSVVNNWDLTLKDPCSDDSLALTANIADFNYNIGATAVTKSLAFSKSVATTAATACPYVFKLELYSTANSAWEVWAAQNSFEGTYNTAVGSLTFNVPATTTNYANASGTYRTRISVTSTQSEQVNKSVSDEFIITVRDQCTLQTLASTLTIPSNPYTSWMWDLQTITFTGFKTSDTSCDYDYKITTTTAARTDIAFYSYDTFPVSNGNNGAAITFKGRYIASDPKLFNYEDQEYYVRGLLKDKSGNIVLTNEVKYTVRVNNPCVQTQSIKVQNIAPISRWVKEVTTNRMVPYFKNIATEDLGAQQTVPVAWPASLCGPMTYKIFKADKTTEHTYTAAAGNGANFLSMLEQSTSNRYRISLGTSDPQYYQNTLVQYYLQVKLTDYAINFPTNAIYYQGFTIIIKNCLVSDLTFGTSPSTHPYNVYTPEIYATTAEFVQVPTGTIYKTNTAADKCGYTLDYTQKWFTKFDTRVTIPSWIVWDQANWRFKVYSIDPLIMDLYATTTFRIELIATVKITDMNPVYTKTQTFNIVVSNGCLQDQGSLVTAAIASYTYYLNNTPSALTTGTGSKTHTVTWNQSVTGCPLTYSVERTPVATGTMRALVAWESAVLSLNGAPRARGGQLAQAQFSPLTETYTINSQNLAYDLQLWNVNFVQTSTHSTHANRQSVLSFNLTLKNKCWDLTLNPPNPVGAPFNFKLYYSSTFSFTAMTVFDGVTNVGDYCNGFTYELESVTAPTINVTGTNRVFTAADFTFVYNPKTQGTTANLKYDFSAEATQWIGTHTMKITGKLGFQTDSSQIPQNDGLFTTKTNPTDSDPITVPNKWVTGTTFTATFVNPCDSSTVKSVPVASQTISVGSGDKKEWFYALAEDSESLAISSSVTNFCGPRSYEIEIEKVGTVCPGTPPRASCFYSLKLVDQSNYSEAPYLLWNRYPNGHPKDYSFPRTLEMFGLTLESNSNADAGVYQMTLVTGIAGRSGVTKSRVPFTVTINPCEVTTFDPPADIKIKYVIGEPQKSLSFSFAQSPCKYKSEYTSIQTNGTALPDFMHLATSEPYFTVFTTDINVQANYTIVVTNSLDNVLNFGPRDGLLNTPINSVARTTPDPDDPSTYPTGYKYKSSFKLELEVYNPDYSIAQIGANNTDPYLVPPPQDASFSAGEQFTYKFGYVVDNEGDNVEVRVELGALEAVGKYNYATKSIEIQKGASSARDTRDYRINVFLTDDSKAVKLNDELDLYLQGTKEYSFIIRIYDAVVDWREERRKEELAKAKIRAVGQLDKAEAQYEVVNNHIDEWAQSKPISVKAPRPFPISMDNSGVFQLGFTQPIKSKDALKNSQGTEIAFRGLSIYKEETYLTSTGFRNFEVRPALQAILIPAEGSSVPEPTNVAYKIVTTSENGVSFQFLFENPDQISASLEPDTLQLTFWSDQLLISEDGVKIPNGYTITKTLSRQMDPSQKTSLSSMAETIALVILLTLLCMFMLNLMIGSETMHIVSLIHSLQLILHTTLFTTRIDGQVAVMMNNLLKLVRLKFWATENENARSFQHLNAPENLSLNDEFYQGGYQTLSLLPNLSLIILGAFPVLIVLFLLAQCKDRVQERYFETMKTPGSSIVLSPIVANAAFSFLKVAFLELTLCSALNFQQGITWTTSFERTQTIASIVICGVLLVFTVYMTLLTCLSRGYINADDQTVTTPYVQALYTSMDKKSPTRSAFYMPFFIMQRLGFVAVAIYLPHKPTGQVFIYLSIVLIMMCIIAHVKPFADYRINRLLMANEFTTLLCAVIMLTASSPNVEPLHRRQLGFGILGLVALLTLYNLVYVLISTYSELRYFCMKRKVDAWKDKDLNSIKPGTIIPFGGMKSILEEVIAEVSEYDSEDEGEERIRRRRRGPDKGQLIEGEQYGDVTIVNMESLEGEDVYSKNRTGLGFTGNKLISDINATEGDVLRNYYGQNRFNQDVTDYVDNSNLQKSQKIDGLTELVRLPMDRDYNTTTFNEGPTVAKGVGPNHPRMREKRRTAQGLPANDQAKEAYEGMFNVNLHKENYLEPQDRLDPMEGLRRVSQANTQHQSTPSFNNANDFTTGLNRQRHSQFNIGMVKEEEDNVVYGGAYSNPFKRAGQESLRQFNNDSSNDAYGVDTTYQTNPDQSKEFARNRRIRQSAPADNSIVNATGLGEDDSMNLSFEQPEGPSYNRPNRTLRRRKQNDIL